MVLVESFRGLSDRFAVCEKGQVATENFVVFRVSIIMFCCVINLNHEHLYGGNAQSCEDISVKDFWVSQLKMLLQKDNESLTRMPCLFLTTVMGFHVDVFLTL